MYVDIFFIGTLVVYIIETLYNVMLCEVYIFASKIFLFLRASVCNVLLTYCKDNVCRLWVETFLPNDCLLYGGDSNHWTEPINLTNNFERNASSKERVQNTLDVSDFIRCYFLQVLKPVVCFLFCNTDPN